MSGKEYVLTARGDLFLAAGPNKCQSVQATKKRVNQKYYIRIQRIFGFFTRIWVVFAFPHFKKYFISHHIFQEI